MNTKKKFERPLPPFTADDLPQGFRDDFHMDSRGNRNFEDPRDLSDVIGSSTGESDRAVVAGGWAGTDDATSTAPSDLDPVLDQSNDEEADENAVPELSAGIGIVGATTDIKGTPSDDSRDWEADPIIADR